MDVEIASSKTRSRRSASSGVSRPATSESEGFQDRYHLDAEDGDEADNDDELNGSISQAVPVQPTKKKNVAATKKKRDDVLKSEVRVFLYLIYVLTASACSVRLLNQ